jgi:hypothetical protein
MRAISKQGSEERDANSKGHTDTWLEDTMRATVRTVNDEESKVEERVRDAKVILGRFLGRTARRQYRSEECKKRYKRLGWRWHLEMKEAEALEAPRDGTQIQTQRAEEWARNMKDFQQEVQQTVQDFTTMIAKLEERDRRNLTLVDDVRSKNLWNRIESIIDKHGKKARTRDKIKTEIRETETKKLEETKAQETNGEEQEQPEGAGNCREVP